MTDYWNGWKRFWEFNYFSWGLLWFDSRNARCHAMSMCKQEWRKVNGRWWTGDGEYTPYMNFKEDLVVEALLCLWSVLSDVVQVTSPYGGGRCRGGPISLAFRRGKRDKWDVVPKGKSIHANAPNTYSSFDQPTTALHINTFSNRDREWRRLPSPLSSSSSSLPSPPCHMCQCRPPSTSPSCSICGGMFCLSNGERASSFSRCHSYCFPWGRDRCHSERRTPIPRDLELPIQS